MCAERQQCTVCLPSLASIAQALFVIERGHTDRQTDTDATDHATHGSATAGVSNEKVLGSCVVDFVIGIGHGPRTGQPG